MTALADGPLTREAREPGRLVSLAIDAENFVLSIALAAMVLIPVSDIAFRMAGKGGISGSTTIVQHLTLVVSMIGAAVAAREKRLLSFGMGELLRGRARAIASLYGDAASAAISGILAFASWRFVAIERESAKLLVYSLPVWVVQAILPVGFALIALRVLWNTSDYWPRRATAAAIAVALILAFVFASAAQLAVALGLLAVAAFAGAPIFALIGGAALILFKVADVPLAAVSIDHYSLTVNPALPMIPLFTLAGYLLAEGGATRRIVRLFDSIVGPLRGGPAIVTALGCAFFTSFTGGSGVTILALGGLLMPVLLHARYSQRQALGLLTGAGSLGLLFPPCLPLILYAIVANVQIEAMFLGGIVPGMILVGLTIAWGMHIAPVTASRRMDWSEARSAVWAAKWELLLPSVLLGALFSGLATPVEAAAFTAFYVLVVTTLVHSDYRSARELFRVIAECGLLVGGVLLILGVALGFTNYLIDAEVPARAVEWATTSIGSPLLFLLALNVFLLIVGCLMDVFSAIIVVAPLIVPIGLAFGIDPVHLGIIFLANLELGYLTPPVGMNLFLASYRFKARLSEVYRAVLPMFVVLLIGVLLITYLPFLTTALPRWILR
jgi:C4-dicarboxylate transporter, DctM subunit